MQLKDPKSKPEHACSIDETRYALCAPYLDVEAETLVATDGRSMALFPVSVTPDDKSGHVSPEAFKHERQHREAKSAINPIRCGEAELVVRTVDRELTLERREYGCFPDYKAIAENKIEEHDRFEINLNIAMLAQLCKALGILQFKRQWKAGITLTVSKTDPLAPIYVCACDGEQAGTSGRGVIMPIRKEVL